MQRAAELLAIGSAVATAILASKAYMSPSLEPECQYRYGISQCSSGRVPEGCLLVGANGLMRCFDEEDPRSPVIPPAIPRDATEYGDGPYPGTEKNEPSNITWLPEEDPSEEIIFWAGGIPRDTNAAQFIPLRIMNEEEGKEDEVLWSEAEATGLCGEGATAAILNAISDDVVTIQDVVSEYVNAIAAGDITRVGKTSSDLDPSYTGPGELQQFIDERYGDILDADGTNFYWSNLLDIYPFQWNTKPGEVYNLFHDWLDNQQYTIAGVEIVDGSRSHPRGGWVGDTDNATKIVHWVVLTGISSEFDTTNAYSPTNWVRVYNPFDNSTEYYWYPQFMEAWVEGGNMSLTVTVKEE